MELWKVKLNSKGLSEIFFIESAGTYGGHAGESPDQRAMEAAKDRGYDLSYIRSYQIQKSDFDKYDYILAMDRSNLADLKKLSGGNGKARIKLFTSFSDKYKNIDVPDPYYGGNSGFSNVLDIIEETTDCIINNIQNKN